ncbi:MAG: hypothetical protein E7233_13235 [Lachnospiraceae bacterium]|nr:hypothetical protein [Lachnospiraceae bacterium]
MKLSSRIISVLLASVMIGALAGCGGSGGGQTTQPETPAPSPADTTAAEETTSEETEPETEAPYEAMYSGDWQLLTDEESGVNYWKLDAVYVQNPIKGKTTQGPERGMEGVFELSEDGYIQHIAVFAPESYMKETADGVVINEEGSVASSTGLTYTALNAPVVLRNYSGGYTSSTIKGVNIDYIKEGLVYSEIQTRGKEIIDENGKFIGQFPALIVDMKAGIKWLRHCDEELPGNSEAIVSTGHSSGGAVSAMLGASGDSPVFDEYFKEIGAYDESDVILVTHASAPITNLSSADASYEWFQTANPTYFLFNAMAFDREGNDISAVFPVGPANMYPLGSNMLGGAHEDELSKVLYDWYVKYVQDFGLDLGDDGRSGEFYEGFIKIYEASLEEYIERYDELHPDPAAEGYKTLDEYLAGLGEGWFTIDEASGKVTIADLDTFVQNHIKRKKMCPSLDSYNYKSNENNAFKDADGNISHFSGTVYEALKQIRENYDKDHSSLTHTDGSEFTEEDLAYLDALIGDYETAGDPDEMYMLEVMSPVNYVADVEGFEATPSKYWRLRIGSEDGDHGAPAAWLIYEALKQHHPETVSEIGIAWGFGHEWAELTVQDFFDYIAEVMKQEGLN